MKKVLVLVLSLVLVASMALSGTIAYLTSTDSDVNVMTVGNVKIEQLELQRKDNTVHTGTLKDGDLVDFEDGVALFPAFPKNNAATDYSPEQTELLYWGPYVTAEGEGNGLWNPNNLVGAVDKMVFVKNTGTADAYYRTWFAFECPKDMEYGQGADKEFMMNTNAHALFTWKDLGYKEIDGTRYLIKCATYKEALKPDEISRPSLLQVVMTHNATNEDVEALGSTYEILAFTQAVQVNNMPDAETALKAAFGEAKIENHPWLEGTDADNIALVETADEMIAALESGKDVSLLDDVKINPAGMSNAYGTTGINIKNGQTIDGNGNTLDIKGAGGTWDSGINTTGGLIKNLKVTGSFRGVFINHNSTHSERVVLDNVIIDGTTYTISCDQGLNQGLTANNSTFKGWTSFAGTLGDAEFNNCNFGEGNGYAYCHPYAPTVFRGCEFEAGYTVDARDAVVLFENCTLGGVPFTTVNLKNLVGGGFENVTVK